MTDTDTNTTTTIAKKQAPKNLQTLLLLTIILLCASLFTGVKPSKALTLKKDDPKIPWHIVADKVSYDKEKNLYTATGNVIISKQEKKLTAGYVQFNHTTMEAFARDNVVLATGDDILSASSMDVDLNNEVGVARNSTLFLADNHFYIRGETLEKIGPETYAAKKAVITTCDGENPDWKITGRDLNVTIEGYAKVKHAALWARSIPALYTPYFIFPAKTKRQSGFLIPTAGYSDDKGGFYGQGFFWAISDSTDATFYADYMHQKGLKTGVEFRYAGKGSSKGTMMIDYINDNQDDENSDPYVRTDSDRYWFVMKADQDLPWGFSGKLDIDIASDTDYLSDFNDSINGFDKMNDYFNETFGRELDADDDRSRENTLSATKNWGKYSLNAQFQWYDDLISKTTGTDDTTLQTLPSIEFNSYRQQIMKSPFYFDLDSEYRYFYREETTSSKISGQRVDIHPRVYLPHTFGNAIFIEPSAGFRTTLWHTDDYTYNGETDSEFSRGIYDLKLDSYTEFYSIYNINLLGFDKIKHSIKPQITYEYIPEEDQSDLPYFDSLDKIESRNRTTFTLTNTLVTRSMDEEGKKTYREILRFELKQSYYQNSDQEYMDQGDEHLSPLAFDLDFTPIKYFSLNTDGDYDFSDGELDEFNAGVTISDKRNDSLSLEYRYDRSDDKETALTALDLQLTDQIMAYIKYELNLIDHSTEESHVGLIYKKQCWSLDLSFKREDDDEQIAFLVHLYGLGKYGTK